jgi:hypothetical protein
MAKKKSTPRPKSLAKAEAEDVLERAINGPFYVFDEGCSLISEQVTGDEAEQHAINHAEDGGITYVYKLVPVSKVEGYETPPPEITKL